jgi:hypothetical protein
VHALIVLQDNFSNPTTAMTSSLRYTIVSTLSLAVGFFACQTFQKSDEPEKTPNSSASSFESDALGFVNWYRIEGREAIPHEVLIRNLQILESKAIASGQLISARTSENSAEQAVHGNTH